VIKRDFQIPVVGELRPISEQHVFAPADGQVIEVLCDYGDAVKSGQNLIRLESAEYQLKQQQLQARLATAQQQLEQNQLRLMQERRTSQDRFLPEKIAADIEQLKLEIQGLERELSSYEALQRELSVTAPISGQIISRDRRQLLLGRPVTRGTILATVSDTNGPWQLVCEIQDRDSGYLFAAQQAGQVTDWKLTFKRTSALDREHQVQLERWEDHNFIKPNGDSVVRAYAELADLKLESLRVGQTITGQIYAGRKSLFFLWTRDLQDLLKRKFWWPGS
jgi:multidrug efflux pump subunit AcrA (membrane-fusion protein)